MINVSEALDFDIAGPIFILRTSGEYVDGLWANSSPTRIRALASTQQPTPAQLMTVKEGERSEDMLLFICNKPLRASSDKDGTQADVVLYKSNKYKVVSSGDWSSFGQTTAVGARFE